VSDRLAAPDLRQQFRDGGRRAAHAFGDVNLLEPERGEPVRDVDFGEK